MCLASTEGSILVVSFTAGKEEEEILIFQSYFAAYLLIVKQATFVAISLNVISLDAKHYPVWD